MKSYDKKDYSAFLKYLKEAVEKFPDDPKFRYTAARAYALNRNKKRAIKYLDKSIRLGYYFNSKNSDFNISEYDDFRFIRGSKEFRAILKKIERMNVPVNNSQVAYRIPEKDLMPEGIAYDPVESKFYIGSVYKRKIITIKNNGDIEDFTEEMQDGLWSVTGMKVDIQRRILWANSSALSALKNFQKESLGFSSVFKYNLNNGELIKKYLLPNWPDRHLFNDLVINSDGDLFITDSLFKAVYMISTKKDELELFLKINQFGQPNGIALSDDEKYLYVAYTRGIAVIDVKSKDNFDLSHAKNISLVGIDGLYFYKKSLIAVQIGFRPVRVAQFLLNKNLNKVINVKVIEAENPLLELPTTGVIFDNHFYYLANSQLNRFTNGKIFPESQLDEIAILRTKL